MFFWVIAALILLFSALFIVSAFVKIITKQTHPQVHNIIYFGSTGVGHRIVLTKELSKLLTVNVSNHQ